MVFIACLLILATVVFLLYSYMINKDMSKGKITIILGIVSVAIIILCLHLKPPTSFDLYRYFDEMNYMRNYNFSESIQYIFCKPIFIWHILERIVTLIFYNNSMIFIFTIPITVIPFLAILLQMREKYKMTNRQIVISIFSFFSIISTVHLMSGIRNALAVAMYAIGLNLNVFKQKKIRIFVLYNSSIYTSNGNYFLGN